MTDRDRDDETVDDAPAEPPAESTPETPSETAGTELAEAVSPETRKAFLNLTYGLVALVIFFAGIAIWPLASHLLPASWQGASADLSAVEDRLAALEARPQPAPAKAPDLGPLERALADESAKHKQAVAALGRRLAAAEQEMQALPRDNAADGDAVEALSRRLDGIEGRLSKLGTTPEALERLENSAKLTQDGLAALEARVAALEKIVGSAEADSRRRGLVLATGQLAAALGAGRPYTDELKRLDGFAGGDDEIEAAVQALAPGAGEGIATLAELRRRFQPLAGEIVRAGDGPASDSWWSQAGGRLKGLVTVRRTGEVEGSETDAVVARAEVRLAVGDLAAAVAELKTLEGAAAEAAAGWRRSAETRLVAEAALARLQARAIALLSES